MKQILQNMSTGETSLVEVPVPQCARTGVLVQATNSLISIGADCNKRSLNI